MSEDFGDDFDKLVIQRKWVELGARTAMRYRDILGDSAFYYFYINGLCGGMGLITAGYGIMTGKYDGSLLFAIGIFVASIFVAFALRHYYRSTLFRQMYLWGWEEPD